MSKNIKKFYGFFVVLLLSLLLLSGYGMIKMQQTNTELKTQMNKEKVQMQLQIDTVLAENDRLHYELHERNERIRAVHENFRKYNPECSRSFAEKFIEVVEYYELDSSQYVFEHLMGQILVESAAQQRYHSEHPKSGDLVVSYAGAVGVSQIMPSTCHIFLKKMTPEDSLALMELGCTSFERVIENERFNYESYVASKKWLSDINNNIILWGYIMNHSLDVYNDNLYFSFISYNAGPANLTKFLRAGNSPWQHEYVRMIENRYRKIQT